LFLCVLVQREWDRPPRSLR